MQYSSASRGSTTTAANVARTTSTQVSTVQHIDAAGTVGGVTMNTKIAGEDTALDILKVREYFAGTTCTADTQVKAAPGFLHSLTFYGTDAAATAGSIIVYDNTAESGTIVFNMQVAAAALTPITVILDRVMNTGIYVGFTTTNDVGVSVSWG